MIRRGLQIGRWRVTFLFAGEDARLGDVLDILHGHGAPEMIIGQVSDLLEECDLDCGFTFSDPVTRQAVVYTGPTSSGAEFLDTFVHEVHHLAVAIAESLGIDLDAEGPAYLAGDTARALAEVVCTLGCSHCHVPGRRRQSNFRKKIS